MKHDWTAGNEGMAVSCRRPGCGELKTEANGDADDCGVRRPPSFYMDDLDYLAQRLRELRAEREAALARQDEQ